MVKLSTENKRKLTVAGIPWDECASCGQRITPDNIDSYDASLMAIEERAIAEYEK
jgi:hypothetical protein